MELAQGHRIKVDLDDRLLGSYPGVVGKARAEYQQQVTFIHAPAGHRGAAASKHTRCQRMIVGNLPFGLEGREHWGIEFLCQLDHLRHPSKRTVTNHDDRTAGGLDALHRDIQ